MGLWPFQRKSNRKRSHGGADISRSEEVAMHDAGTPLDPDIATSVPERRSSRKDKKRRSSRDSKKLKRNPQRQRTYSFSPGRDDHIRVARDANHPPVPQLPANLKSQLARANSERQDTSAVGGRPPRSSTQPPENSYEWPRMPTLHKRAPAAELARRKSSKRRKDDHDRELEIKAMVAFMPERPKAEQSSSGRLIKRDSQKMGAGLNRILQNPSSDISLPTAESMRSSLSSGSDRHTSYKLSPFDVLAPRPTIKYAENPRYIPGASGFGSDRSDSRKRRLSDRVTLNQEVLKANKRIDELADDLSAGELRELMERDQKRREKKKIVEKIKAAKRVARRQEKQKAEEDTAARDGTPPPANLERGVLGRDVIGLGIGTSAVVTSSKRKGSTGSDSGREKRNTEGFRQDSTTSALSPLNTFYRTDSLATDNFTPASDRSEPIIEIAKTGTVAKASISPSGSPRGHARGASSISQIMNLQQQNVEPIATPPPQPELPRKSPRSSTGAPSSWKSFFRRSKSKRASTPSSFSNTSRDSMPAVTFQPPVGFRPRSSNIPKRTMSKFREDLPELPISPPYSRVQSPEVDDVPPIRTDYPEKKTALRPADDQNIRYDTPNSGYRSIDAVRLQEETPTSGHRTIEPSSPSPEPTAALSQSLASIDSEGSWLSGRKGGSKRGSAQLIQPQHPLRDSANSLQKRYREYSESTEELGIAEDEYFSRLTPGPEEEYKIHRISTGNPMPSSDDEDGGSIASPVPSEKSKWGAVGRNPTVVHREPRAKSREGLLNEFERDDSSIDAESQADFKRRSFPLNKDIIEENEPGVNRATSVEYRTRHARHISAGSAKLLDLKPKASGEAKRLSLQ